MLRCAQHEQIASLSEAISNRGALVVVGSENKKPQCQAEWSNVGMPLAGQCVRLGHGQLITTKGRCA